MNRQKSLVVFYSRTGTTKEIAGAISKKLECDTEEIFTADNRKGFFGFMKCSYEAIFKKLPAIREINKNPASYDIVIIGTPIWVGTMSSPIRTYLSQNSEYFKNVAFFCTHGGSGGSRAFGDVENIVAKKPLAVLELKQEEVREKDYSQKIEKFAEEVGNGALNICIRDLRLDILTISK